MLVATRVGKLDVLVSSRKRTPMTMSLMSDLLLPDVVLLSYNFGSMSDSSGFSFSMCWIALDSSELL